MPVLFNIDSFPTLNPAVEDALRKCLLAEVAEYTSALQGTKCKLCPFRVLSSLRYLKKHLKHHCVKNMFLRCFEPISLSEVITVSSFGARIKNIGKKGILYLYVAIGLKFC